ncbi:hypothetical protein [Filimonas effusa]|uniref:DUF4292 domain-containing protein n=1 Tax=Filimonas effusa TaxID=2508721 RepID=A0A4Q1D7K5_9BACT|nr:hypothetical protein [Filimonas effusa]RXK85267.1 hypothetical protein ESB13_00100 [Filimonas effusa]
MRDRKNIMMICCALITAIALSALAAKKQWISFGAAGQQSLPAAAEEYKKLFSTFLLEDSLMHVEGQIELFDAQKPEVIKETLPFSYAKNGNGLIETLGGMQTISNGHLVLQLDTVNHYIMLGLQSDTTLAALKANCFPLKQLVNDDSANYKIWVTTAAEPAQRRLILMNALTPEIKEYRINYDTASYHIQYCEIEWWKNPAASANGSGTEQTLITKTYYRYLPALRFNPEEEMKKIITLKDNTLQPAKAYQSYKLYADN